MNLFLDSFSSPNWVRVKKRQVLQPQQLPELQLVMLRRMRASKRDLSSTSKVSLNSSRLWIGEIGCDAVGILQQSVVACKKAPSLASQQGLGTAAIARSRADFRYECRVCFVL